MALSVDQRPMLARRIRELTPSPTAAVNAKARELKRQGVQVLNLSVGEPDFDTPDHIKDAAIRAIRDGFTKYTEDGGIPELKEAVCAKLRRDNGLEYTPKEVLACTGGKHVLYTLFQTILDEGDEVVIPVPAWATFVEEVKLAGGRPVRLHLPEDLKLRADDVAAALTPRTRAVLINNPSNPTGIVHDDAEIAKIAQLALDRGFFVISDEIYEHLVYDGRSVRGVATLVPAVKPQTIITNSLSKTYAMPGWRVGYCAGPAEIVAGMTNMLSNSTSNLNSIAQKAAIAALTGPQDCVQTMRAEFDRRRQFVIEGFDKLGYPLPRPQGAFYAFPRIPERLLAGVPAGESPSAAFASRLLTEAHVAIVPGVAFDGEGHFRLSYATSMDVLHEVFERLATIA